MIDESFIEKSPDYSLMLDTFANDSVIAPLCPGGIFYTAPEFPPNKAYFYLAPIENSGETRADDTGVIKQNDLILLAYIAPVTTPTSNSDTAIKRAYRLINEVYRSQKCGNVTILSATKVSESPVMFDDSRNVRIKKITLSIQFIG